MSKSKAISPQVLLGLLKTMRPIRLFEETVAELFKKGLFRDTAHIERAGDAALLLAELKRRTENPVPVFC